MKVVTAEIMQKLDRRTIEEAGIPGIVLMENAGRGAVREILAGYPEILKGKVAIIAGRGNNGGDGFVIARYLMNRGVNVKIFLLAEQEKVKGDARLNLDILLNMKASITEIKDLNTWKVLLPELEGHCLIVDAIFGTGLRSEVKGMIREVIDDINYFNIPKVAVDLPSGLNANTGEVLGTCIKADLTITFALPKRGLLIYPGADFAGRLKIVDISIPAYLLEEEKISDHVLSFGSLSQYVRPRKPNSHKGDYGHVLIIAGSQGKTGAAALSCQAAVRVGAGLVTLGIPESLNNIMEEKLTEVMTEPLTEEEHGFIGIGSFEKIEGLMKGKKVLALGPGISTHEDTVKLVHKILVESTIPLVIDADGINALSFDLGLLKRAKVPVVLTPHPGEMARLVDLSSKEIQKDRITIARDFAKQHGCYLVLKGTRSLIAEPEGNIFINPTGNAGMASGGMGDVLTGMIPGFISQGYDVVTSTKLAVFVHGLAGDLVALEKGPVGLIAGDLVNEIPRVLKAFIEDKLPPSLNSEDRYQMGWIL
jgi:NAD(P)H-hydrate epimerase